MFKNADKAEWEEMETVLFYVVRKKKELSPFLLNDTLTLALSSFLNTAIAFRLKISALINSCLLLEKK